VHIEHGVWNQSQRSELQSWENGTLGQMSDNSEPKRPPHTGAIASDYGVVYLVAKTGISRKQAISLVDEFGSLDFEALEVEAAKLIADQRHHPHPI
jgi:hypothetical protein